MQYSAAVAKTIRVFGPIILLLIWATMPFSSLRAADTEVIVNVCGGSVTGSSITINSPQNDSVVSSQQVVVSGNVSNATQIEITIDGNYDSTLPLDPQANTYETTVNLSPGTHTIELVANDVCGQLNDSASVVVTYEPTIQPGTGAPGATIISPGNGGVSVGSGPAFSSNGDNSFLSNVPIVSDIVAAGADIARALDFDTSGQRGGPLEALLRISFVTVGLLLAVFGSLAIGWLLSVLRWLRLRFLIPFIQKTVLSRSSFMIRLIGVAMFLIALLI